MARPEAETDYSSVMTGKTPCSQIGIDWEAQKKEEEGGEEE